MWWYENTPENDVICMECSLIIMHIANQFNVNMQELVAKIPAHSCQCATSQWSFKTSIFYKPCSQPPKKPNCQPASNPTVILTLVWQDSTGIYRVGLQHCFNTSRIVGPDTFDLPFASAWHRGYAIYVHAIYILWTHAMDFNVILQRLRLAMINYNLNNVGSWLVWWFWFLSHVK